MKISFAKGNWDLSALTYAYSTRWEAFSEFTQEDDCVCSCATQVAGLSFENIPLLARQPFTSDIRITTRCAFESFGAPLITFTGQMETDSQGYLRFAEYLEVVLYEKGINVWHLEKKDGKWVYTLLMGVRFPVAANQIHTLSVTVRGKDLYIDADDHSMSLHVPGMYSTYYAGITACEGINRFYDLQIEEI